MLYRDTEPCPELLNCTMPGMLCLSQECPEIPSYTLPKDVM